MQKQILHLFLLLTCQSYGQSVFDFSGFAKDQSHLFTNVNSILKTPTTFGTNGTRNPETEPLYRATYYGFVFSYSEPEDDLPSTSYRDFNYFEIGLKVKFVKGKNDERSKTYQYGFHSYQLKYSFKEANALGIDAMVGITRFWAARFRTSLLVNRKGLNLGVSPEAGIDVIVGSLYVGYMIYGLNPMDLHNGLTISLSGYIKPSWFRKETKNK